MFDNYDPDDSEAKALDDRNERVSDDEPRGTYPPIEETSMNTHIGFSDPDPAIDDASEPVAIYE